MRAEPSVDVISQPSVRHGGVTLAEPSRELPCNGGKHVSASAAVPGAGLRKIGGSVRVLLGLPSHSP